MAFLMNLVMAFVRFALMVESFNKVKSDYEEVEPKLEELTALLRTIFNK